MRVGRHWLAVGVGSIGHLAAEAHAAGPYVVDDAEIGNPGECHVESWVSAASKGSFIGVAQPACVVQLGIPVELTAIFQTVRLEGDWAALQGAQAKFVLVPYRAGSAAVALTVGTLVNDANGASVTFLNIPVTVKMSDTLRFNVNAGGHFDSASDSIHLTWGGAVEWDFHKSWTLIAEVFGETGDLSEPRLQAGLRYATAKNIDINVVYGNNIVGDRANWLTAGIAVRF